MFMLASVENKSGCRILEFVKKRVLRPDCLPASRTEYQCFQCKLTRLCSY